jgi:hypothetical protein
MRLHACLDLVCTGKAEVASRPGARGRELPRVEGSRDKTPATHGLRERCLSERRRVLEPAHSDIHDSR